MGLGLFFHLKFDTEIDNRLNDFRPSRRTILGIYAIGLPAIISQALLTVMTYSLNLILGAMPQVGQNAVTVYGLYYKIQQLIIFAAFGIQSLVISLCRQVLFVLPPVWLLTRTVTGAADVSRVWWPLALGEAATLVVALIMFRSVYRKKVCDLH